MSNKNKIGNLSVKRALISVSDKEGLADFSKRLGSCGVEIIATGGTGEFIRNNGIEAKSVEEVTGFPEIMNGRVKTIHPKIFGGILAREEDRGGENLEIEDIDLVIVNLC